MKRSPALLLLLTIDNLIFGLMPLIGILGLWLSTIPSIRDHMTITTQEGVNVFLQYFYIWFIPFEIWQAYLSPCSIIALGFAIAVLVISLRIWFNDPKAGVYLLIALAISGLLETLSLHLALSYVPPVLLSTERIVHNQFLTASRFLFAMVIVAFHWWYFLYKRTKVVN